VKLARPVQEVIDLLAYKGVVVRQEVGARHIKLFIHNQLAGIHPRVDHKKAEHGRGALNVAAQLKRTARDLGVDV
jgi:hypothetical protein